MIGSAAAGAGEVLAAVPSERFVEEEGVADAPPASPAKAGAIASATVSVDAASRRPRRRPNISSDSGLDAAPLRQFAASCVFSGRKSLCYNIFSLLAERGAIV